MERQHCVAESVQLLDDPCPHHLIRGESLLACVCADSHNQVGVYELDGLGALVQKLAHRRKLACVLVVNLGWKKEALPV